MQDFDRITLDPLQMGGRPCIRGMRITVGMIVGQLGGGVGIDEILADYPELEREDVLQALRYAAWLVQEREPPLAAGMISSRPGPGRLVRGPRLPLPAGSGTLSDAVLEDRG